MGFRIDRSWGRYVATPSTLVKRKGEDAPSGGQRGFSDRNDNSKDQNDGQHRQPTKEELQKAIAQENANLASHDQGLVVAIAGTEAQLRVRLSDTAGHVIREMSAEEFMNLRASSHADTQQRGKVLDQKY